MSEEFNKETMELLTSAYRAYKRKHYRYAIVQLDPFLELESSKEASCLNSMIWGLAGDNYFKLGEVENGFAAYRQSMAIDREAGCLRLFARQVLIHRRVEDAEFAVHCLDMAWLSEVKALINRPGLFLFCLFDPQYFCFRLFFVPFFRGRLRRMIRAKKRESAG